MPCILYEKGLYLEYNFFAGINVITIDRIFAVCPSLGDGHIIA